MSGTPGAQMRRQRPISGYKVGILITASAITVMLIHSSVLAAMLFHKSVATRLALLRLVELSGGATDRMFCRALPLLTQAAKFAWMCLETSSSTGGELTVMA